MMENNLQIVFATLLGVLFYGAFFYIYIKRNKANLVYKKFFHAVSSILKSTPDNQSASEQFKLIYKKLSEKYPNQKDLLRNPIDLLEELIFFIDTYGIDRLKTKYGVELVENDRSRILEIVSNGKNENPFNSLPSKEAGLLRNLNISIENNNIELGKSAIKQLAEELEILDSNLRIQVKRNYTSYLVSIIGVVLTLFFGFLSLMSLIN